MARPLGSVREAFNEHFLRWVLEEPTASEWGGVFMEEPYGFVV
jgi:hypothetical protein